MKRYVVVFCGLMSAFVLMSTICYSMLVAECMDPDYLTKQADYVVLGTVEGVRCQDGFCYNNISIEQYFKGRLFPGNSINLKTLGGPGIWVEDEPVFTAGDKVELYLEDTSEGLQIVCGSSGVKYLPLDADGETLNPETLGNVPTATSKKDNNIPTMLIMLVILFIASIIATAASLHKNKEEEDKKRIWKKIR